MGVMGPASGEGGGEMLGPDASSQNAGSATACLDRWRRCAVMYAGQAARAAGVILPPAQAAGSRAPDARKPGGGTPVWRM